MARRKIHDIGEPVLLHALSVADLYAMLAFVRADRSRGFSSISAEQKAIVDRKHNDIEEELYRRTYGHNPFKKKEIVIDGQKPEEVLDNMNGTEHASDGKEASAQTFIVTKNETPEPKDEHPSTFVVAKNE